MYKDNLSKIEKILGLIEIAEKKFNVRSSTDHNEPLLYCGVINSKHLEKFEAEVEQHFGKPYKPTGKYAFFKNYFDNFVKEAGGIRKSQTLYRKDINEVTSMFCAFWPWKIDNQKTTIRLGLICFGADERAYYLRIFENSF